MIYKVALVLSDEGYSVTIPGLPGCCSQGETEAEALENIADAIRDYLDVAAELAAEAEAREVEVAVSSYPDLSRGHSQNRSILSPFSTLW